MAGEGNRPASWSTATGRHRMVIRQAVTHLPQAEPEVVAGQIHGADDDRGAIRVEGRRTLVGFDGQMAAVLTDSYELGEPFVVELAAGDGKVQVFYNGGAAPAAEREVDASGCYFKAGCYTQSSPRKGDRPEVFGEVVIYELRIVHE